MEAAAAAAAAAAERAVLERRAAAALAAAAPDAEQAAAGGAVATEAVAAAAGAPGAGATTTTTSKPAASASPRTSAPKAPVSAGNGARKGNLEEDLRLPKARPVFLFAGVRGKAVWCPRRDSMSSDQSRSCWYML